MTPSFVAAIGLVFVFEGLLPFLAPRFWRRMIQQIMIQNDKAVRVFGLMSMLTGVGILYILR